MAADSETRDAIALLQAELARLRDAFGQVSSGFITWFTWFFTLQIAILSWIIAKEDRPDPEDIIILASALIVLNLLGVIAAIRGRAFFRLQDARAGKVCRSITVCAERLGLTDEITSGFEAGFVISAFGAFAVALLIGIAAWSYVICKALHLAPSAAIPPT